MHDQDVDQSDGNARGERIHNVLASGARPEAFAAVVATHESSFSTKRARKGSEVFKMAYNRAAIKLRRCTATKADGSPCQAWAVWGDPQQRCASHVGRQRRRPTGKARPKQKTRYMPCRCPAYAWPHRPGGGLCRWPLPPEFVSTTPAGTHSRSRLRPPWGWRGLVADGGNLSVNKRLCHAGHPSGKWED